MSDLFWHRNTAVWALMVAATSVPLLLGAAHGVKYAAAAALVIAFVKVRYIGLEFMELRGADVLLRRAFQAWVVVVGGTVIGLFLVG
jgi:hypothetical protein